MVKVHPKTLQRHARNGLVIGVRGGNSGGSVLAISFLLSSMTKIISATARHGRLRAATHGHNFGLGM